MKHIHAFRSCRSCGDHDMGVMNTLDEFEEFMHQFRQKIWDDPKRSASVTAIAPYYLAFNVQKEDEEHQYFITYRWCEESRPDVCQATINLRERLSDLMPEGLILAFNLQTGETEVVPLRSLEDLDKLSAEAREQFEAQNPQVLEALKRRVKTGPAQPPPSESLPADQRVDDDNFKRLMNL